MNQSKKNIFYAQSGGGTAVINTSACGVIEEARKHPQQIGKVLAGRNGILGALHENLIDTSLESPEAIAALRHTPACAFGSCRYKLKGLKEDKEKYLRLLEVFKAHDIGYFFYNGGNDSHDTAHKVSQMSQSLDYPLTCIGIPKTIDNDLAFTDNCPGFGSVAKYVATSIREASLDVACMAATSTKVFVLEVMGRHAGWIVSATGLAGTKPEEGPHIILFPEIPFDPAAFFARVKLCVEQYGHCVIAVSEGLRDQSGYFLAETHQKDAFGHSQLGGVAPTIANLVHNTLGYKVHWAVSDYLQRAARHIAAKADVDQAYALGQMAVREALAGKNNVMISVVRKSDDPYAWETGTVSLAEVANVEKKLPRDFITADGFGITQACRTYLQPLISGEDYPPYENGLPVYVKLKNIAVQKHLEKIYTG